jgi:hypothetical protein
MAAGLDRFIHGAPSVSVIIGNSSTGYRSHKRGGEQNP